MSYQVYVDSILKHPCLNLYTQPVTKRHHANGKLKQPSVLKVTGPWKGFRMGLTPFPLLLFSVPKAKGEICKDSRYNWPMLCVKASARTIMLVCIRLGSDEADVSATGAMGPRPASGELPFLPPELFAVILELLCTMKADGMRVDGASSFVVSHNDSGEGGADQGPMQMGP